VYTTKKDIWHGDFLPTDYILKHVLWLSYFHGF